MHDAFLLWNQNFSNCYFLNDSVQVLIMIYCEFIIVQKLLVLNDMDDIGMDTTWIFFVNKIQNHYRILCWGYISKPPNLSIHENTIFSSFTKIGDHEN